MHTLVDVDERLDTIEAHLVQVRDDVAWIVQVVERSTRAASDALEDVHAPEGVWRDA